MQRPWGQFCHICAVTRNPRARCVGCTLPAAGNQLQTVEPRSTAVNGAGGAEERPNRSLFFTQDLQDLFDGSTPV
ncbi:hypothetical protein EPR50_G00006250 [Perca flavescens]|uniref:Uncharacterized protein n=1 Tax=Perca flavescens TaxID=8167 RepID=A0A484DPN2_PERFV|nr:hypothetical protein EPR50_G00006250 [Perca flavescens]